MAQMALEELEKEKKEFSERNLLTAMANLTGSSALNDSMRHAAVRTLQATKDVFKAGGMELVVIESASLSYLKK